MDARLQNKILALVIPNESSGCWIWKGQISNSGLGKLKIKNTLNQVVTVGARETSYQAFIDEIPDGKMVNQSCGDRLCVNPEHLILKDFPAA